MSTDFRNERHGGNLTVLFKIDTDVNDPSVFQISVCHALPSHDSDTATDTVFSPEEVARFRRRRRPVIELCAATSDDFLTGLMPQTVTAGNLSRWALRTAILTPTG